MPQIKEEWKRLCWKSATALRLMASDAAAMIELKAKESSTHMVAVHKALICFYSPYHDKLLNGPFMEGTTNSKGPLVIDESRHTLELFFAWLYSGRITTTRGQTEQEMKSEQTYLVDLYIFADSLNCVALQRSIMTRLHEQRECPDWPLIVFEDISKLSGTSLESSQLYRYMVDSYTQHWNGTIDDGVFGPEDFPENFGHHLSMSLINKATCWDNTCGCGSDKHDVCCNNPCEYHGHGSDEERRATCGSPDDAFETQETNTNHKHKAGNEVGGNVSKRINTGSGK